MPYAEKTSVSPEKSRGEIERILSKYGASAFSYGYEGEKAVVAFQAQGRFVRFEIRTPPLADFQMAPGRAYRRRTSEQQRTAQEQAIRQRWRALALVIKAKLESIESGIESFDEAFMPHILLPDHTTAGDWLRPQIERAYETGVMPDLLPASRPQLKPGEPALSGEVVE